MGRRLIQYPDLPNRAYFVLKTQRLSKGGLRGAVSLMLNPRQRFDIVKDPVHGYIRFTRDKLVRDEKATEADLINSPWLQRLRRIHQLQTAWYVYPMADHARFSHSLGAMELAGRFARAVYAPFYAFHRGLINWHMQVSCPSNYSNTVGNSFMESSF